MEITSLKKILAEKKQVAFIKGNRSINQKNVSEKELSFGKDRGNMIPLMYVSGEKAIEDGCTLMLPDGTTVKEKEASNFIAIIDGQHRYTAAMNKQISSDKIMLFENYTDAKTKELIADCNTASKTWTSNEWINGAFLAYPDNEVVKFAEDLNVIENSYSLSTISLILYHNKRTLNKDALSSIIKGFEAPSGYNIERANKFIETARMKFSDKFIRKRYLINVVIELMKKYEFETIISAIPRFSDDSVKFILEAKPDAAENTIQTAFKTILK